MRTAELLEALAQAEGGVQINLSRNGATVATRYTPLVKGRGQNLFAAAWACASNLRAYIDRLPCSAVDCPDVLKALDAYPYHHPNLHIHFGPNRAEPKESPLPQPVGPVGATGPLGPVDLPGAPRPTGHDVCGLPLPGFDPLKPAACDVLLAVVRAAADEIRKAQRLCPTCATNPPGPVVLPTGSLVQALSFLADADKILAPLCKVSHEPRVYEAPQLAGSGESAP